MLRKKGFWIIFVILLLMGGSGFIYYKYVYQVNQQTATEEPALQTTRVTTGNIIVSAAGSGKVVTMTEYNIGFSKGGLLKDIFVEIGDQVEVGDPLAVLGDLESLEAAVAADQLSLLTAQQALDDLYENPADEYSIAQAEYEVFTRQTALDDLVSERQSLEHAPCSKNTTDAYYAEFLLAQEKYLTTKEDFEAVYSDMPEDNLDRATAQSKLSDAEYNYNLALGNLNYCRSAATEADLEAKDAEIKMSEAELAEAEKNLEELKNWQPDQDEIELAELKVSNAEVQLSISQKTLEQALLISPVAGTVLEINAEPGENVGTSSLFAIADIEQPVLEIFLDETDLDKIGIDYEVEVTLDAMPDQVFLGHVIHIDPQLNTVNNVGYIRGLVQLDDTSYSKPLSLPIGLSALVEVIGTRREGVLIVPVEALREIGDGEYAVFMVVEGTPRLTPVTVGVMDYTVAEITSGLNLGDIVTTGIVETE